MLEPILPHPYIPRLNAHFCYIVFEQPNGVVDYSDVKGMETTKFPVNDVVASHGLELVTSNYFVVETTILADLFLQ